MILAVNVVKINLSNRNVSNFIYLSSMTLPMIERDLTSFLLCMSV